ncbi:MAG: MFS transporter [Beijerinckiaceae bacterium]|nr:MFS transporter [Beijerinckiaceae bacterium]
MFAQSLARLLARYGIHYGWIIVAVTAMVSISTAGAVGLPGVFILPFGKEFGWDAAQVSSALAIRLLLFGLMAPFAAALIERYGVRRIVLIAVSLVVSGMLLALGMTELWQLVLLWGVIVGLGTGLTALVLGAVISTRWFTAKRGLVLGILTASNATGQLIFLPIGAWLIDTASWRAALALPVGCLIFAALMVVLFMRDRPADIGLRPYGESGAAEAPPRPAAGTVVAALARPFGVLRDVVGDGTFWILFITFFICGLSTNGLIQTHFIPLCGDFGMGSVEAASTLAMMGVFDFFGTIASGWLSDRYDNRKLLFWYYGLRGLSLLVLPYSTFTLYGLSLFAAFYGLDWIATVPPTVKLAAQNFGRERAAIVFGWVFTGHQLGAATAAYGAGLSRTVWLTYLPAFYFAGGACLIAAILVIMIRRKPAPGLVAAE